MYDIPFSVHFRKLGSDDTRLERVADAKEETKNIQGQEDPEQWWQIGGPSHGSHVNYHQRGQIPILQPLYIAVTGEIYIYAKILYH